LDTPSLSGVCNSGLLFIGSTLISTQAIKPKFYSKHFIAIATVLLSPILGSILFAYNLREVGKGKLGPWIIVGGIICSLLIRKITLSLTSSPLLQLLIGNVIGGLVLAYAVWDMLLGEYHEYEPNRNWKPILVFVAVCVALILFQLLASRP
jgi:hypothetical protein